MIRISDQSSHMKKKKKKRMKKANMGKGEFPTAKNDKGTGCHYSLKDSP